MLSFGWLGTFPRRYLSMYLVHKSKSDFPNLFLIRKYYPHEPGSSFTANERTKSTYIQVHPQVKQQPLVSPSNWPLCQNPPSGIQLLWKVFFSMAITINCHLLTTFDNQFCVTLSGIHQCFHTITLKRKSIENDHQFHWILWKFIQYWGFLRK